MYQPGESGHLTGIAYYVANGKIVADRNIFDPNRYPHTQRSSRHETRRATKTADLLSLIRH